MTTDTYAAIRSALSDIFRVPQEEITPEITLEELQLDSLALAEFALILEERLGVKIDPQHAVRTTNIAEITHYIDTLRTTAAATV
jgi:acyl carrier protein